jgi:hypothetical protein
MIIANCLFPLIEFFFDAATSFERLCLRLKDLRAMTMKVAGNRRAFRLVLMFFFLATPAYAYIDPNAQGLISQALTPIFVIGTGVMVFFRDKALTAVRRLSRYFTRPTDGAAE